MRRGDYRAASGKLPAGYKVLVVCQSGMRSEGAARFLRHVGYERVTNLRGGSGAWKERGLPVDEAVAAGD